MLKVAIHCHSTYSDGEFTLAELREAFGSSGYQVVCMTDHAESFDSAKLQQYVSECESLSDEKFSFIAGLEFECERRMHILGYGVTSLVNSIEPHSVIKHIEDYGGVSVIAHPGDSMFDWIESFELLPTGIETWNSKYDGPYAPRPRTFDLLKRLQQRKPTMKAFYGQDLHWRKQQRNLFNLIDSESSQRTALLNALRMGHYSARHDEADFELASNGDLPDDLKLQYGEVNDRYMRKQRVFKRFKKMSGSLGKNLPTPVKARLRKLFS
jgi:PHP domain